MDPVLERYQALEARILQYNPKADTRRLSDAFQYADGCHSGQLRKDGSPFVTHPLAVAEIVAELELDVDSVIAALLHDCIEDTAATHEEISKQFGRDVADLVDGVTKLTRVHYTTKEEEQMENLRKMLMAMAKDIRVILIKICDRLHNMRTMNYQTPRKQREKALETMEIYAPIAHRLGMQRVKWELEDTSLQYLDPVGYKEIQEELDRRSAAHEEFMAAIQKRLEASLEEYGVRATVYGRVKHIYSIYRKMYTQNKTMDEIFDLYAFRVIVDDVAACYGVLGNVHDIFKPVLGRFKDYIGTPKPNLYQSLHTTVIGRAGIPFEIQIRTWEMHHTAEYGIAAHWKYKQGMGSEKLGTEGNFEWVRKLLETQQDTEAEEYVHSMKVDLFSDEVFLFTPRGDVVNLPSGSTPIDFAYNIHSAVGNAMTGCKVNGRIVTFDYKLKSGEIVEVITSKSAHGPSRDWMKLAKSNEAKNKIKQWFKKERREENIITGRSMFESELKRAGYTIAAISDGETLSHILKKVKFNGLDDLYAAIGYGGMSALKAVNRIKEEMVRLAKEKQNLTMAERLAEGAGIGMGAIPATISKPTSSKRSDSGIVVEGLDNCSVKFAKCCAPVPGDAVVGFVTRGFGVSVHRADCVNAIAGQKRPHEAGRWLKVDWVESDQAGYSTALDISAKDRDGLTLDVAMTLSAAKIKTTSLSARGLPDGYAIISIVLEVKDKNELATLINKLSQISGVYQVKRAAG